MNILYIAYSCDPFHGSEDKIGWNIPWESAKNNNVIVITKMEHRETIENYIKRNNRNIHFFYVDIPNYYKKIFNGSFYSGRLSIWNKKALKLAQKICFDYKIQIVHQITPVEFRAVGKYYKIPNVKYIVGPIGGAEYMQKPLMKYISCKERIIELIRYVFNLYYRLRNFNMNKIKKYNYVFFANTETKNFCYKNKCKNDVEVFSEVGIAKGELVIKNSDNREKDKKIFVVSSRLVYRKGHLLLLDAIKRIDKNYKYEVKIIGDGKYYTKLRNIIKSNTILSDKVKLCGKMKYDELFKEYDKAYALIMPSLRETTGTVLVEAMSKSIPIIAYKGFGANTILNDENAYLYYGNSKEEIIENLSNKIMESMENNEKYQNKKINLQKIVNDYLFEEKVKHYERIYKQILNND